VLVTSSVMCVCLLFVDGVVAGDEVRVLAFLDRPAGWPVVFCFLSRGTRALP
jgi:hypothetical protein